MPADNAKSRWGAILAKFLGVNAIVQAVALVVGILIIRGLPQELYGYYAVVTSLIAAFVLLADSGLTGSFISSAAPYRNHRGRVGALLANSLRLQRRVALLVGTIILVTLGIVLTQLGASPLVTIAAVLAVGLSLLPLANKSMIQGLHRLMGSYARLQKTALVTAVFRLVAIALIAFTIGLNFYAALAVLVLATFLEAILMQWGVRRTYPATGEIELELQGEQLAVIRRTMPASLTIVAQTQLVTLVTGLVGGAVVLAEVSALSRFALLLAVFAGVATDLGVGAVARSGASRRKVLWTMGTVLGAFLLVGGVAVLLLWALGSQLLWLLGPEYSGLQTPLIIVGIGTVGIMVADLLRQLNQARGWTRWSWVFLPLTCVWLAIGLFLLDLSQIEQAATWMALQAVTGGVTQLIVLGAGLARGMRGDTTS